MSKNKVNTVVVGTLFRHATISRYDDGEEAVVTVSGVEQGGAGFRIEAGYEDAVKLIGLLTAAVKASGQFPDGVRSMEVNG